MGMNDAPTRIGNGPVAFTPASDYLLVRFIDDPGPQSRLVMPHEVARGPRYGVVVASGDGYYLQGVGLVPNRVSVGNTVLLQYGAGTDLKVNGETFRMVPERDLFATDVVVSKTPEDGAP